MLGKPLPITGTGEETRDFTYVLDLVQGLIKAGYYEEAIGENFNLAAGREISIKNMAELVMKTTGNKADFILEYNENCDKNLKRENVDWSQSRVLFVSPAFSKYQRQAINFRDYPLNYGKYQDMKMI